MPRCPLESSAARRRAARHRVLDERAWAMRHAPTDTEARLFQAVRAGGLGVAFRRQVPLLARYIADLFVPELKLVVEIDGGVHACRRRADARRDRALTAAGYTVVRIDAALVNADLDRALELLRSAIERLRGACLLPR